MLIVIYVIITTMLESFAFLELKFNILILTKSAVTLMTVIIIRIPVA